MAEAADEDSDTEHEDELPMTITSCTLAVGEGEGVAVPAALPTLLGERVAYNFPGPKKCGAGWHFGTIVTAVDENGSCTDQKIVMVHLLHYEAVPAWDTSKKAV